MLGPTARSFPQLKQRYLLSALEEVSEVGPQPLYPGLTLFRSAQVALVGHDLRDLDVDVSVLGAAL